MSRNKKVRLVDIAEKTGYSITTISHIINKTRNVDESTKEIVLKAINDLGYQLPSKRTIFQKSITIGLIIADIRVDFFNEIIREIEGIAYEVGYNIIIMDSEENPEKEIYCIKTLIKEKVAGIILAPCNTKADLTFCANFPIVQIDRMLDNDYFDFVGIDNMMATYYLTKRILHKKKTNIGLINFNDTNYCARERGKGYKLAMLEVEQYNPNHTLITDYDANDNHLNICKFISAHPEIDTIISASSNICYEILGKIKQLGNNNHIKHICTFDNNKWLDHVNFPVDAVSQPITDIAITAVEMLKNKILNPQNSGNRKRILLNCSVEGRSEIFQNDSTNPLRLV